MPSCDVVIPTYNNGQSIGLVLEALYASTVPPGWSLRAVVSDDGSTDDTLAVVSQILPAQGWEKPLVLEGVHGGAAAARNTGIKHSTADIIFFLGADIILHPDALRQHLDFHTKNASASDAALGLVTWDPLIVPTPLMSWMTHGGPQNDFDALLGEVIIDPRHFFTASHLSLKRALVSTQMFDERFKEYGWEDLDLGRRLVSAGLSLYVLHSALGWHHHFYTPKDISARQYAVGKGLVMYQDKYPEERLLPPRPVGWWWKQYVASSGVVSYLVWLLISWVGAHWTTPRLFQASMSLEFWKGVDTGERLKKAKN